jgi:myo-inositol catabolism protein IolS
VSGAETGLGCSTLRLRRFGFGCEQLGGYDWGSVDVGEVEAAVDLAVRQGVTFFDTADCYGRGASERHLGRILGARRTQVILATKFGVRFTAAGAVWYDSSPAWARQALDESLVRLGTDFVDLLQMHYWDGSTPLPKLFDCLERLREEGRIRFYGVTNHVPTGVRFSDYPGLVSASLEYSLVERSHERIALDLGNAGLTFLAYGSLGQGLLSGKYPSGVAFGSDDRRSRSKYRHFHGAAATRNARIVEMLRAQAQALNVPPSQLAIAWVLRALPAGVPLVGIKRAQQLQDVLGALQLQVPAPVFAALEAVSAPTPVPA